MQMTDAECACPVCGERIRLPAKARRLNSVWSADYKLSVDSLPLREHMTREHSISGLT